MRCRSTDSRAGDQDLRNEAASPAGARNQVDVRGFWIWQVPIFAGLIRSCPHFLLNGIKAAVGGAGSGVGLNVDLTRDGGGDQGGAVFFEAVDAGLSLFRNGHEVGLHPLKMLRDFMLLLEWREHNRYSLQQTLTE